MEIAVTIVTSALLHYYEIALYAYPESCVPVAAKVTQYNNTI